MLLNVGLPYRAPVPPQTRDLNQFTVHLIGGSPVLPLQICGLHSGSFWLQRPSVLLAISLAYCYLNERSLVI